MSLWGVEPYVGLGVCVPMGCGTLCRVGLTLGVCVPGPYVELG